MSTLQLVHGIPSLYFCSVKNRTRLGAEVLVAYHFLATAIAEGCVAVSALHFVAALRTLNVCTAPRATLGCGLDQLQALDLVHEVHVHPLPLRRLQALAPNASAL